MCNYFTAVSVLLPFGVTAGDELVPPALDGTSDPVFFILNFSNLSCPFYGVEEDTLFVSLLYVILCCSVTSGII